MQTTHVDTAVIGGGQAGLAVGYHLAAHGRAFVILEAAPSVGWTWRRRWDSLRLFTPACVDSLPGMSFPAQPDYWPSKDEVADYLEAYAASFKLPVMLATRVDQLVHDGGRFLLTAGAVSLTANQVVIATGATAQPRIPSFATKVDPAITQLHSVDYRNPSQLRDGAVLIVGAGNSGAEIAVDLAAHHPIWLAGRDTGHLPLRLGCRAYRLMQKLTVDTWPGRWISRKGTQGGTPLVRVRPKDLADAGVQRVPRVVGVDHGQPVLADQSPLVVRSVVWCTGFVPDFRWVKLPVFDGMGDPIHHRGVARTLPGLYFVGLPFQSSAASGLIGGMSADAEYVVAHLARHTQATR